MRKEKKKRGFLGRSMQKNEKFQGSNGKNFKKIGILNRGRGVQAHSLFIFNFSYRVCLPGFVVPVHLVCINNCTSLTSSHDSKTFRQPSYLLMKESLKESLVTSIFFFCFFFHVKRKKKKKNLSFTKKLCNKKKI